MNEPIEQLPVLGIGASLSLDTDPDPVRLVQHPDGPDFVEYAGQVDAGEVIEEVDRVRNAGVPVLYHPSYINFCGSMENSSAWLDTTALHIEAVGSPWFAQDCAYCFWQEGPGYSSQLGYFIPPILNAASLDFAVQRIHEVQERVNVPVAIEPPPMTFVAGHMPLFQFFGDLVRQTNCAILLDMGHLVSYEMASGKRVRAAIEALPCDRVIEIHVAGGRLKEGEQGPVYVDAHESDVLEQTWTMFDDLLPELPNVRAVCFECEGVDETTVLQALRRLRTTVQERSASDALKAQLEDRA